MRHGVSRCTAIPLEARRLVGCGRLARATPHVSHAWHGGALSDLVSAVVDYDREQLRADRAAGEAGDPDPGDGPAAPLGAPPSPGAPLGAPKMGAWNSP